MAERTAERAERSDLALGALRPCDVLLFHGTGLISRAIRFFDGSDYNHAALVLDATTLAESDKGGIQTNDLKDQMDQAK